MNAIWTGAISFGMVTVPVKLYSATEQKDVRFRLLHREDLAPVHEKRFCTAEDREVAWDDLVRGVEVSKGEFVTVDTAELEAIEPESAHTIAIDGFVDLDDIDPVYFEKSYLLEPVDVGARPFSLLRRTLEQTGRVAVARVTIRTKERLATLRVYEKTLMLETMFWPDEVRSTDVLELPKESVKTPSERELEMARMLVESLSAPFRPEAYTDRYREAVQELVDRKLKGQEPPAPRQREEPKVVDLMAALEASLAAAKERGGAARAAAAGGDAAGGGDRGRDGGKPERSERRTTRSRSRSAREDREKAGAGTKVRRRRSAA